MYYVYKHINDKNEIIYVGLTTNMWNRQNTHLQKSKWRNEINKIEYCELKNKNSMEFLEIYLINKFMPKYNVKDKNGYDLSWMDEGCSNFKFKEYKHGDVVKIEYNTKKEYKKNIVKHKENVLHKPNQMISINKTTLTPLQNSIIDLFLYVMQEYKLNNISTQSEDMFDEFFELDIYKYRKLIKNGDKFEHKFLKETTEKIANIKIETRDRYKFESMVLFPNVSYSLEDGIISFKANSELIIAMFGNKKIIREDKLTKDIEAYYTSYDHVDLNRDSHLTGIEINMCQELMRYKYLYDLNKNKSYTIDDFKDICGIKSNNNRYIRKTIIECFKRVNEYLDYKLNLEFKLGKHNRITLITITPLGV